MSLKLIDLSMDFAVEICKLCNDMKYSPNLIEQLLRSGTSIGANIREQIMPIAELILFLKCRLP